MTPDHWHAATALAAMKAGKDVYVEKPMTLTIEEGKALVAAEKKYGRIVQVGSQQRSEIYFRIAANLVRNGMIGDIKEIYCRLGEFPQPPEKETIVPVPEGFDYDRWLGPTPFFDYSENRAKGAYGGGWRCYWEYGSRKFGDWGAHHFDIAQWALEMDDSGPREVIPPANGAKTGLRFIYASGIEMIHGGPTDCTFQGPLGTIECSRGHVRAYRGVDRAAPDAPELLAPPAAGERALPRYRSHIADFLDAIREGRQPIAPAEVGHRTATICQLCNIGYEVGEPLTWDPVAERFTGANAAAGNALLARPRRRHA
jgi:predicted dehydrogenase